MSSKTVLWDNPHEVTVVYGISPPYEPFAPSQPYVNPTTIQWTFPEPDLTDIKKKLDEIQERLDRIEEALRLKDADAVVDEIQNRVSKAIEDLVALKKKIAGKRGSTP